MVGKNNKRVMLPSDPEFRDKMSKLKVKILVSGGDTSFPKLTKIMAQPKVFEEIEKKILEEINNPIIGGDIIKFDRRKKIE